METAWYHWVNEPIYKKETGVLFGKRKTVIADLCFKGIFPLVKNAGYKFERSEGNLVKQVLILLFQLSRGKKVLPRQHDLEIPYAKEQYIHFHDSLDAEIWLDFWDVWGGIQDLHEGSFGYSFRFQLPEFIWSWLDVTNSPTVVQLEKELLAEDYHDEMSKGKDDPYLQDTLKRDYADRHWF